MFEMKKVTARQYVRHFDPESLKPGQTVLVTKNGKPYLEIKKAGRPSRKAPNLANDIARHTYNQKTGDELLAAMLKDMA